MSLISTLVFSGIILCGSIVYGMFRQYYGSERIDRTINKILLFSFTALFSFNGIILIGLGIYGNVPVVSIAGAILLIISILYNRNRFVRKKKISTRII